MAVVFDAISSAASSGNGTTFSNSTLMTVGSGSNRALIVILTVSNAPASATAKWNNVSMTLLQTQHATDSTSTTFIFGLRNPASGTQTLSGTISSAQDFVFGSVSFTGVEQSSDANAFTNANGASGASSPASVTITSATGDMTVAGYSAGDGTSGGTFTGTNNNTIFDLTSQGAVGGAANYASGAATVTMTGTYAPTTDNAAAGVNVHAAAAATTNNTAEAIPGADVIFPWTIIYQARTDVVSTSPETVTESRWHQPWSEPVRQKVGIQVTEHPLVFFDPLPFVSFSWFNALSEPVRQALRIVAGVPFSAQDFPEPVTEDMWHQPWSEPVRRATNAALQSTTALTIVVTSTQVNPDSWYIQWLDPTRRAWSPNTQQFISQSESAQFPESVTEDRWHEPWAEPVRQKPGLGSQLQQTLAFTAIVPFPFPDALGEAFAEPVRLKQGLSAAQQQFLAQSESAQFAESVTEDRWHQPWSEPVRTRTFPAAEQVTTALGSPPDVIGWYQAWSDPVRVRAMSTALQPPFDAYTPQQTTVPNFGYFNPFSDPVRVKLGLGPALQSTLAETLVPSLITPFVSLEWLEWMAEPVRQKLGLSAAQQSWTAQEINPADISVFVGLGWFLEFSNNGRSVSPYAALQLPYSNFPPNPTPNPPGPTGQFTVSGEAVIDRFPVNDVVYTYAPITRRTN